MDGDAKRFRERARECRNLVDNARDPEWRRALNDIADDLETEADKIEAKRIRAGVRVLVACLEISRFARAIRAGALYASRRSPFRLGLAN
jgi:hypothetical protein